jgi:hypothetical protein
MRTLIVTFAAAIATGMAARADNPPIPAPAPILPTIVLRERHGHVTPSREGFTHTGGGIIDVAQPAPDTVIITMTGAAVAGGHPCKDSVASLHFDLDQCLEIAFAGANPPRLKAIMEARAIGLLRSHAAHCACIRKGAGSAEMSAAHAEVGCGSAEVLAVSLEPHAVAGGENLSINDHIGPCEAPIIVGRYNLRGTFAITASHPRGLFGCKAASAEFAPDPALDPLWISYWEPFHGVIKKDLGFVVIVKVVVDDTAASTANGSQK